MRPPVCLLEPESYEFELFGVRVCTLCKRSLPANQDYFVRDRSRPDGITSRCRECRARDDERFNRRRRQQVT